MMVSTGSGTAGPASSPVAPASPRDDKADAKAPVPAQQRRARLRLSVMSWKKQKISPLVGTASTEEGLVEAVQRVDLDSQWANLPDHLLEAIFGLMKEGKKNDWKHMQVRTPCLTAAPCRGGHRWQ